MKIKKRKNNFKIKLTHKELVILEKILSENKQKLNYPKNINNSLYDKDEIKYDSEILYVIEEFIDKAKKEEEKEIPY